MTAKDINKLYEAYFKLLGEQKFESRELDYSILDKHKPNLQQLAHIGNSVISVFDVYKKEHVFNSSNLGEILGYSSTDTINASDRFWDEKIHQADFYNLLQNSFSIFKLFFNFSRDEKLNHKLISEYRILNSANKYIRVIEQQQVLELDQSGNLWLALSILDISPNQKNITEGLKSEILNFKTGQIIPFIVPEEEITTLLTNRELEVLKLVKEGYLSKEISDKLAISLFTVNTHRQRVLEKLGVKNSMEAVQLATKLGLI